MLLPPDDARVQDAVGDEVSYLLDCWWSTVVDLDAQEPGAEPGAVLEKRIAAEVESVTYSTGQDVLDRTGCLGTVRRTIARGTETKAGKAAGRAEDVSMTRASFLAGLRRVLGCATDTDSTPDDAAERRRVDAFHDRIGLEAPGAVEASPII